MDQLQIWSLEEWKGKRKDTNKKGRSEKEKMKKIEKGGNKRVCVREWAREKVKVLHMH